MSNTPSTNNHQEEIDLGYLIKRTNQFFINITKLIYETIILALRFKLFSIPLFLLMIVYGYYLDSKTQPILTNETIVIPNFESVDYLYDKVHAVNSKRWDSIYMKNIFGSNYKQFKGIEIEPIVDIYDFVSASRENVEIFKAFSQSVDVYEYIKDVINSKYYKYHRLRFRVTGSQNSEEIKNSLLIYFNENQHYSEYSDIFKENTKLALDENLAMISQIDSIIKATTSLNVKNTPNQSVLINDNSNLNGLIHTKKMLVEDRLRISMRYNDEYDIIKEVSSNLNLKIKAGFSVQNIIKYPFLFLLFLFAIVILNKLSMTIRKIGQDQKV